MAESVYGHRDGSITGVAADFVAGGDYDEQPVLDNFRMKVKDLPQVESLNLFLDVNSALNGLVI